MTPDMSLCSNIFTSENKIKKQILTGINTDLEIRRNIM